MEKTLNLVVTNCGPLPKKPSAMDAVMREIEIRERRLTWFRRILEAF